MRATPVIAVLAATGAAVAVAVVATDSVDSDRVEVSAHRHGVGAGTQAGPGAGKGLGRSAGHAAVLSSGTLTTVQRAAMASMAEEEKLAHDLYVAFAARYDDGRFDRISAAETKHLGAIRTLLTRYRVTDPTKGMPAGAFQSDAFQDVYDDLLASGSASLQEALDAGATVERHDIADLRAAMVGLTATDVKTVYTNLVRASQQHLAAFTR